MNWNLFLHIIVWVVAIGSSLLWLLGTAYVIWSHTTVQGRLDRAIDAFNGRSFSMNWTLTFIMIVAWIAVFCLV